MIKGCQRRIIMVKDTKSRCFDAAYFVLKGDLPQGTSEADMLSEANRVIDACSLAEYALAKGRSSREYSSKGRRRGVIALTLCSGLGIVVGIIATLICNML